MIDTGKTTLESNYWIGAQGGGFWIGQVEGDGDVTIVGSSMQDVSASNRVKVRIVGYHSRDRKELPPEDLPWATVMMPSNAPTVRNAGTVHGLENGAWVIGTFLDGESAQQPLVMGSIGITEKSQSYEDRLVKLTEAFDNNFKPRREELRNNNKPGGVENNGPSGRGQNAGSQSANDKKQKENEKQIYPIANGKCGPRPESEVTRILNDLFKFVGQNDKVGSFFVDKVTGNAIKSVNLIGSYVSRFAAIANGLLGDIKALILYEVKEWFQKYVIKPITDALSLSKNKKPEVIWATNKVADTILEIIKCIFKTILEKLLNFFLDLVLGLLEDLLNSAFCLVSNILSAVASQINGAITQALSAVTSVISIVSAKGDYGGSIIKKIGSYIAQFCDGNLSCFLGIGEFSTKEGEKEDNKVESFFNRMDVLGNVSRDLEVGLYGSDSFLSTLSNTKIVASDGTVIRGSLDCSKSTKIKLPAFPRISITRGETKDDYKPPTLAPIIDSYGQVVGVYPIDSGRGYISDPDLNIITYNDYGEDGSIVPLLDRNGGIIGAGVKNSGGGYPYFDGSADNTKVPVDTDGNLNTDQLYGVYSGNPFWLGIISLDTPPIILNTGSGYDENCKIIIESPEIETAEVVHPILQPEFINGRLASIKVIKEGFGYTTLPKIYVSCGGTAKIAPVLKYVPRKDAKKYLNTYDKYATIIDCVGHPGDVK